jgi:hypothetical protein
MEDARYAGRLRYLDANDVDAAVVNYDGLNVSGPDGRKIGDVDGFIINAEARRVYYVVVDSGGWFSSRRLLLPIGHATLSPDRRSLQVDVTKDALEAYPEFREDRFREFSDDELRAFERTTWIACCPDEPLEDVSVATWAYDTRRHYRQPDWWAAGSYAHERLRPVEARSDRTATAVPERSDRSTALSASRSDAPEPSLRGDEHAVARGDERTQAVPERPADRQEDPAAERDMSVDVSPHYAGRAQPGDVLGIETGGEQTHIADTAEDEDKRRREADRELAEEHPPGRSER